MADEYPKDDAQEQLLETLLWSECDDDGNPLDDAYGPEDIDQDCVEALCKGWEAFRENYHPLWDGELTDDSAAHDFILTRNGHGAGFWDRGITHGDELTKACKPYGCVNLYVGDDGKLYTAG